MENEALDLTPEETATLDSMREERPIELVDAKEPEAAPEKTAEAPAEPKADAPAEPAKPVRLVPHEALHEAREQNKALRAQLAAFEAASQRPEKPQPIDETTDPIGAISDLRRQIDEYRQREDSVRQQAAADQALAQAAGQRLASYVAEHPEYTDQLPFLRQSRFNELRLMGADERAAAAQIEQEEKQLALMAIQQDLDLGRMVADLATHRGWRPKEAPPKATPDAAAEATIERLQRGQKAAVSPSKGGGESAAPEMTLNHLLSLEGAAFDAAFKAHGKRLMGG